MGPTVLFVCLALAADFFLKRASADIAEGFIWIGFLVKKFNGGGEPVCWRLFHCASSGVFRHPWCSQCEGAIHTPGHM